MEKIINFIKKEKLGIYKKEESLLTHNTYKIDIKAFIIVYPDSVKNLIKLIKYIRENNLKHLILGKGSNIIFDTDYYDGIVIKLDKLNEMEINDNYLTVGAGYSLVKLALETAKKGLSGLEFAAGIPGTVGGAIYMNAGAYKSDMGYVVKKIKVLTPDYKVKTLFNKDLNFQYRTSFLKNNKDYICLEATLKLEKSDVIEIMKKIQKRRAKRQDSQPLEYPSAGSTFRNPKEDVFAGKLIEDSGLKGKNINGAEISEKHANFVVNKGGATGKDIITLIKLAKEKVKENYGIDLILEQEIIK